MKKVNRGPKNQKQAFYVNLGRKQVTEQAGNDKVHLDIEDMSKSMVVNDWSKIVNWVRKVSFLRPEKLEFENRTNVYGTDDDELVCVE